MNTGGEDPGLIDAGPDGSAGILDGGDSGNEANGDGDDGGQQTGGDGDDGGSQNGDGDGDGEILDGGADGGDASDGSLSDASFNAAPDASVPADFCPNMPGVKGHPDCSFTYPTRVGFTLALVEEFATPIDLVNDAIWTYSDGAPDESAARFTKDGLSFSNGHLNITLSDTSVTSSFSHAEEKVVGSRSYRSGELRTKYNNYRYGRYEVSFKAPGVTIADPNAAGGYVASFFSSRTPRFTHWREINFMQTGYSTTSLSTDLLNGDNQAAWSPAIASLMTHVMPSNARSSFHEYAFVWLPTSITWYLDGNQIRQDTGGDRPIPTLSAKIMMSLWAGAYGGDLNSNEYPLVAQYDWVRFYQWDGETTYPTNDPANDLPHGDLDGSKNNPEDGVADIPPDAYVPPVPDAGSSSPEGGTDGG
jgi:hypothetical protein